MGIGVEYAVFQTRWGYFGLVGTEKALLKTHLPADTADNVKIALLAGFDQPRCDTNYFSYVQDKIKAYFEGCCVDFSRDIPLLLERMSLFARTVLATCRDITYGQKISYGQLARRAGCPGAGRAIGAAMAANPLPLLIPCHRVIRSDGQIGGFSAKGGVQLKKKLLEHEKCTITELTATSLQHRQFADTHEDL